MRHEGAEEHIDKLSWKYDGTGYKLTPGQQRARDVLVARAAEGSAARAAPVAPDRVRKRRRLRLGDMVGSLDNRGWEHQG